jgi:hypothetical protein
MASPNPTHTVTVYYTDDYVEEVSSQLPALQRMINILSMNFHLVEFNHSKRYYALLDRMLPDWRTRG